MVGIAGFCTYVLLRREASRIQLQTTSSSQRDGKEVRDESGPQHPCRIRKHLRNVYGQRNAGETRREELIARSSTAGEYQTNDPCAQCAARDARIVRIINPVADLSMRGIGDVERAMS